MGSQHLREMSPWGCSVRSKEVPRRKLSNRNGARIANGDSNTGSEGTMPSTFLEFSAKEGVEDRRLAGKVDKDWGHNDHCSREGQNQGEVLPSRDKRLKSLGDRLFSIRIKREKDLGKEEKGGIQSS